MCDIDQLASAVDQAFICLQKEVDRAKSSSILKLNPKKNLHVNVEDSGSKQVNYYTKRSE